MNEAPAITRADRIAFSRLLQRAADKAASVDSPMTKHVDYLAEQSPPDIRPSFQALQKSVRESIAIVQAEHAVLEKLAAIVYQGQPADDAADQTEEPNL